MKSGGSCLKMKGLGMICSGRFPCRHVGIKKAVDFKIYCFIGSVLNLIVGLLNNFASSACASAIGK